MSALSAFNNLLVQFFDDISESYPEEADIKAAANALRALKKMNPKRIHSTFMSTIHAEFKDPILRKDEDYLVKRAHEILNQEYTDMGFAFWIFDKHWKTMSDTNKEVIWKWCRSLVILAEKV